MIIEIEYIKDTKVYICRYVEKPNLVGRGKSISVAVEDLINVLRLEYDRLCNEFNLTKRDKMMLVKLELARIKNVNNSKE